jgi:uncharacterized protein YndB with AHSA1/START domain
MPHEFELHKEISLQATPEQVWEAIATGPGVDSWFMGRTEVGAGEGLTNRLVMAGQAEESTTTAWEPGRRFAYRTADGEDGSFMAMEYIIEGRDRGSTVLRLVHSGVLGGDWETEYEAMKVGWDMYLHTLAQYLTHFLGRTGAPVGAFRFQAADSEQAWAAITGALGLGAAPAEGDTARIDVPGVPAVEGVVDYAGLPTFLGVRTADGLYRFIHSGPKRGNAIVVNHHLFAPDAEPQQAEQAWQKWLDGLTFAG